MIVSDTPDAASLVAKVGQQKISSTASAANASDFVQIPLSQVPRRNTFRSTPTLRAGALVDRVLRFIATHERKGIGKTLLAYNAGDRFGVQTLRNQ